VVEVNAGGETEGGEGAVGMLREGSKDANSRRPPPGAAADFIQTLIEVSGGTHDPLAESPGCRTSVQPVPLNEATGRKERGRDFGKKGLRQSRKRLIGRRAGDLTELSVQNRGFFLFFRPAAPFG
jgi:hypothetical protein